MPELRQPLRRLRPALPRRVPARHSELRRYALSEVVQAYRVSGNYDYLLQVEVADLAAYEELQANRLGSLPSVAMVNSHVAMKTLSVWPSANATGSPS